MTSMDLYTKWYNRLDVQYEMIKFLKNRETCFIAKNRNIRPNGSRMHKVHSVQHLRINMNCVPYRLMYPYNIYHSVALYKEGIPNQTLNFCDKAKSEVNKFWKDGEHIANIKRFDFVVDIDSPSHEDFNLAHQSAICLHDFFMYHGIPHEIRFTGMGFHFIIPDMGFTDDYSPSAKKNIYSEFVYVASLLHDNITEMIDLKIYDSRRVIKCPYSLSCYDEKDYFLCWPITSTEELKTFRLHRFKIENVMDFSKVIKARGTFIFNCGHDSRVLFDECWQRGVFNNG